MHVVGLPADDRSKADVAAGIELLGVSLRSMDGQSRFEHAAGGVNQDGIRGANSSEASHCAKPGCETLAYGTSTGGN